MIGCTPVLLTLDEEANIARTLRSLRWASRVVVVDSGSTDSTAAIAARFSNVAWFVRSFDSHSGQWDFAINATAVDTPYVLALDADMSVSDPLAAEIGEVVSRGGIGGALIPFEYRIEGVALFGSLYPAQLRLLRRGLSEVSTDGHTQLFVTRGPVARLRSRLIHDDRKPLEAFVRAQLRYSGIEAPRIETRSAGPPARTFVRRNLPFGPLLAWAVAYVRAGGPFVGRAASRYATERLLYEAMLRYRVDTRAMQRCGPKEVGSLEET